MKGTGKRVLSVSLSVMMALGLPSGTLAADLENEIAVQENVAQISAIEEQKEEIQQLVAESTSEEKKEEVKKEEIKKEEIKSDAVEEEKESNKIDEKEELKKEESEKEESQKEGTEEKDAAQDSETAVVIAEVAETTESKEGQPLIAQEEIRVPEFFSILRQAISTSVKTVTPADVTKAQVIKENGDAYAMFEVTKFESKVTGDEIELTIETEKDNYKALYLGANGDEEKTPEIEGSEEGSGRKFVIKVGKEKAGTAIPVVLKSTKNSTWYVKQQLYLVIPKVEELMPTPTPTPTPSLPSDVPTDGIYTTTVTSSAAMFKVIDAKLTIKDGQIKALITLSGTSYENLYLGTKADAPTHPEQWIKWNGEVQYTTAEGETKSGRTYEIPVSALDEEIAVAAQSSKGWYDRTLTFSSENLNKTGELPAENTPADGIYTTTVTSSAAMFKVIDAKLTVKEGQITALITLSGTSYENLYLGTKADAPTHPEQWIKWNGEVQYTTAEGETKTGRTYEIPVSALDKEIAVAAQSSKGWYDRTLTFNSADLVKIGEVTTPGNGMTPTPGLPGIGGGNNNTSNENTNQTPTKPDTNPDTESKYESDLSGSTGVVNSKTSLADGVYTPDKFTWSGGSGRVSISCDKVTIKNGQALATLVFSSSSFSYVKANGRMYLPSRSGGKSIFVIPVELNKNNTIIGMTTKMSASHEIAYNIMVYLAAAAKTDGNENLNFGSSEKLDEKAPDIIGLEYQSETKLDYAEYFKIYHYDQDITLLEIDMTKDTNRDPEKETEDDKKNETNDTEKKDTDQKETAEEEAVAYDEDGEVIVQTQEEIVAELYKANVVKYLIVPEDSEAELPVGIEKEMIIVKLPVESAYIASKEALETMDDLKLLEAIKAVGSESDEIEIDAIKESMEEEEIVYAGAGEDLKFREIVKNKIDFAVLSSELLPGSESAKDALKEEKEESTKEKAGKEDAEEVEKTDEKAIEELETLADNFATLGIPMIVDRSADEEEELAKYEWIKVYGILFGCSEKTDQLFEKAVEKAVEKSENK